MSNTKREATLDLTAPPTPIPTGSVPGYITIQMTLPEFPDHLFEEAAPDALPAYAEETLPDFFPFDKEDTDALPDVLPEILDEEALALPTYESTSSVLPEHLTLELHVNENPEDDLLLMSKVADEDVVLQHTVLERSS